MKRLLSISCLALLQISCGSTSGVGTDVATTTTKVATVSSLPTVDVGDFISAATGAVSGGKGFSKGVSASKAGIGEVGTFSRAGCECRQIKKELINQGKQIELNNCYIQTIGKTKNLVIPNDNFSYNKILLSNETLLVRLGNFTETDVHTFKMDVCAPQQGAATQVISYDLVVSGKNITGSVVNSFFGSRECQLGSTAV
ncbi:MAG: hypothetical protein Q7S68_03635 [Deltaproteobacteria bacterium]|nr:hypothetical protein [Deltaproteobacteria bacterium]